MRWYRVCFVGAVLLFCAAIVVAIVCLRGYKQTVREVAVMTEISTKFSVSNLQEGSLRIEGATNYVTFEKLEELAVQAERSWFNHRSVKQEDGLYVKSLMVYLEIPDSVMPHAGRIDNAPEGRVGHYFYELRTFKPKPQAGKIVMWWRPKVEKIGLYGGIYFPIMMSGLGVALWAMGLRRKRNYIAQKTEKNLPPTGGLV